MRVSVIIPSNRYEYIQEALESLKAQTVQPYEVLYLFSENFGCAEKVNRLASIAKGDVLLFLCDDDKLAPNYIEMTVAAMNGFNVDIVYTDLQKFGSSSDILVASEWNGHNFRVSTVPFITAVVTKAMFDKVGGWDKDQIYQDYDFWYRCFKEGASAYHLSYPLFLYRIHEGNGASQTQDANARNLILNKHPELK